MLADRTVQFADEVLDLIDDFVPGVKTRIIAEQLVHQVSDWGSGVAIKMGRRQGATKEHI